MSRSALSFSIGVLFAAVIAYGGFLAWRTSQQANAAPSESAGRIIPKIDRPESATFELTDQEGKPFNSEDLNGQVWVANFFFSNCPATCFRLMSEISKMQNEFSDENVRFVSITVDPKNDTPEALKKYAARFNADHDHWTFLTGPIDKTEQIGLKVFKLPTAEITHSEKAVIMDRNGNFAAAFNLLQAGEAEHFKSAVKKLLKEKAEPRGTAEPNGSSEENSLSNEKG